MIILRRTTGRKRRFGRERNGQLVAQGEDLEQEVSTLRQRESDRCEGPNDVLHRSKHGHRLYQRQPEAHSAETIPPPTNQMVRNVGRRRPFTNCARSPEWNSTVSRVRGSSRLVRTKVGLSPVQPPQPLGFKTKRGFTSSRSHHVAIDRLQESRLHLSPPKFSLRDRSSSSQPTARFDNRNGRP